MYPVGVAVPPAQPVVLIDIVVPTCPLPNILATPPFGIVLAVKHLVVVVDSAVRLVPALFVAVAYALNCAWSVRSCWVVV